MLSRDTGGTNTFLLEGKHRHACEVEESSASTVQYCMLSVFSAHGTNLNLGTSLPLDGVDCTVVRTLCRNTGDTKMVVHDPVRDANISGE